MRLLNFESMFSGLYYPPRFANTVWWTRSATPCSRSYEPLSTVAVIRGFFDLLSREFESIATSCAEYLDQVIEIRTACWCLPVVTADSS